MKHSYILLMVLSLAVSIIEVMFPAIESVISYMKPPATITITKMAPINNIISALS